MKNDPKTHLNAKDWEVRAVDLTIARRLVEEYHYSGHASNTAVYLHGLFPRGAFWAYDCCGIAWWIPPTRSAAEATYPENWQGVLALSRLIVVPSVPTNGASFLLGRSMRLIDRKRWPCLVTYADTWRGHTGKIYRATNWQYAGLTPAYDVWTLDGKVIARKAGPKTRTKAEMLALGARFEGRFPKHKFIHVVKEVRRRGD